MTEVDLITQIVTAVNDSTAGILIALFLYLFFRIERLTEELKIMQGKLTVICYMLLGEENELSEGVDRPGNPISGDIEGKISSEARQSHEDYNPSFS